MFSFTLVGVTTNGWRYYSKIQELQNHLLALLIDWNKKAAKDIANYDILRFCMNIGGTLVIEDSDGENEKYSYVPAVIINIWIPESKSSYRSLKSVGNGGMGSRPTPDALCDWLQKEGDGKFVLEIANQPSEGKNSQIF